MKRIILIHGWGGTSPEHWQNWIVQQAQERKDRLVSFPLMPNPDFPILKEWVSELKQTIGKPDSQTILVGHSLGVPTILRYLEQIQKGQRIGQAILVSGFAKPLKIKEIDEFVSAPFNWKKIRDSCEQFVVIHSDNDPIVPFHHAEHLSEKLGAPIQIEKNGGHITAPDFGAFPRIWKILQSIQ